MCCHSINHSFVVAYSFVWLPILYIISEHIYIRFNPNHNFDKFNMQVIPKKFAENVREKLAETVTLKVPSGSIWNVGLISDGDTYVLKQGWKKFVEDNFLEEKDILIFKYIGDSIFDVNMFDQKNSCEREATHFAIKCEHSCKRKRKGPGRIEDEDIESSDDDDYHPSNDDDDDDYHSAKSSRGLPTRTNAKAYGAIDSNFYSRSRFVTLKKIMSLKILIRIIFLQRVSVVLAMELVEIPCG